MHITVHLEREHHFQDQVRRTFVFKRGESLAGHLHLFASTWPHGRFHHESAGSLGVEFAFVYQNQRWLYRGMIDCRKLWPVPGSRIRLPTEAEEFPVGPMAGMRDDRDDYSYALPDGSERSFRLKYVGFECWASFREGGVTIKLKHFLPGDSDVVVCYPIPVENLLFRTERRLTFDADGFLEDAWDPGAYVRMEQLPP